MANSVNRVIILGHLGQNPDIKQNPNGDPITNISVATSESWKGKDGEKQTKTEWHKVVLFGRSAKFCADYAKKGNQVYLEGKLTTHKWTDKQGVEKYTTEISVDGFSGDFKIISCKDKEDGSIEITTKTVDKHNAAKANSYVKEQEDLDLDDTIPF